MENAGSHTEDLSLNTQIVKNLLSAFVRDEIRSAGFSRAVLGLSGGIDSAVTATIAVEALGKENVLGVMMPYRTSNPLSRKDAELIAGMLGIPTEVVDISPIVDAFLQPRGNVDHVRAGNVMARQRMIILYDISSRDQALVIGTSNKTEILLGYGTLHGDMACAINPLGDLYKSQVWQLADTLRIPQSIIRKKPSADLWEGQTDEDELGFSYDRVDHLLFFMIDERRSDTELEKMGFEREFIVKVKTLIRKNQFKRRPPLIAKVSNRTVHVDFRYARDWGI